MCRAIRCCFAAPQTQRPARQARPPNPPPTTSTLSARTCERLPPSPGRQSDLLQNTSTPPCRTQKFEVTKVVDLSSSASPQRHGLAKRGDGRSHGLQDVEHQPKNT